MNNQEIPQMSSSLSEQAAIEREQRFIAEPMMGGGIPTPIQDRTELVFNHSINIQPLNRGFLVNVGCQSIAFEGHEKMLKYLTEYLANPKAFEQSYRAGEILLNGNY